MIKKILQQLIYKLSTKNLCKDSSDLFHFLSLLFGTGNKFAHKLKFINCWMI